MAGSALIVTDCNTPSVITVGKLWRAKGVLTYRSWKLHSTPWATQRGSRERESEHLKAEAWASAFIGLESGGPGFHGLTLHW